MAAALNAIPGRFSKANPRSWFATVRRDPTTIGILFVAIVIIAGMWIAVETKITQARATKISDVQRENSNLARVFEEHTIRTLEYVNEIVLSIQKQYEAKGRHFDLQTFYKESRPNLAVVRNVVITDETGQIVLSTEPATRLSLADREHIKVHTGVATQEMFISKPVLGRVNKQFSIIATRRANKADGSYAGVVGVAIEPGYFSTFYQEVDLGSRGIVTLVGTDGIVRARLARDSTLLGQDISQAKSFQRVTGTPTVPAATYLSRSAVDNVERIYASRRVRGYPLLVFVGTATNESLATVTADAHADRIAMSLATVVIGICAIFLVAFNLRRRRSQAALHASEQRLRTIIETEPECVKVVGPSGELQEMNAAGLAMLEAGSISEVKSHSLLKFILPEYSAAFISLHRRVMNGEGGVLEFEVIGLRGTRRWLSTHAAPMRDSEGRVTMLLGITRDITGHKQSDGIRNQLAAIVENSNDTIMSRSLDGTILTWNAGAEKMLGYSAKEAIGKSSDFLIPANRKPNRLQNTGALLSGTKVSSETDRLTKDGRVIDVLSSQSPIRDFNGEIVGASIILQDITELKKAKVALQQFKAIVSFSDDAIISKSLEGIVQSWNNGAVKLFGYTATEMIGKKFEKIIPPDRLDEEPEILARIAKGETTEHFETIRLHKNNHLINVSVTISPIRSEDGHVIGASKIARDITTHKQAEAARASLEAQLRESQKMQAIGTLAGGIAHDFNNALATILGNAELARQDAASNPSVLESVEEIRKAGTRARNLVQQILAFSRRQPAERKPIDLAPVVSEATHLLLATLPARLSLEVHCDEVPPVLADASQIEQILINLATNAMQAIHNGPGRISIRLDTVTLDAAITGTHLALEALHARHPERTVRITVSDTGPGMDAATKERIFEPFFTTKPVGEGTGLGLSVVHGIVQGHEGAITVDSEPGKGTTFTVYLPVAEVEVGASTQPVNRATETSPPVPGPEGGPRILYLDDDESLVYLVERLLKRRGYRVAAHTRQEEALQAIRADPAAFDLVLTDYNMPGMSGLDVAREVRAIRPELPVVVTSGFIDETLRAQAEGAGVREVLFKADSVDVFCDAVQGLTQKVQQKTA